MSYQDEKPKGITAMQATQIQLNRLAASYKAITKEDVTCEQIDSTMYVFGSELACLRLFYKMSLPVNKQPVVEYSENMSTWFMSFSLSI